MEVGNDDERVPVLMFPWLAQGHASPFLELAKKLSARNFHIYFCSTPVILNSIKPQLTEPENSLSVELVELNLPPSPDLPPHYHTTRGLPSHLIPLLIKSFQAAAPIFADILRNLNPDLIIYDGFQPWAAAAASSLNIPAVFFSTSGAAVTSLVLHIAKTPGVSYPFPEIRLQDFWGPKLEDNTVHAMDENEKLGLEGVIENFKRSCDIILVKTFREIEAKYIDYLSVLSERKVVPTGPLSEVAGDEAGGRPEIFEWLNKNDNRRPVLFVAFGSECFLDKQEIEEIEYGLELSKVDFLWVLRSPEKAAPEGFLSRVGERGMVVEGWVPQKKILEHSRIGGFLSHCGWSSVVESMKFGVPIIGMPIHLDQPVNAKLVESIGVGFEVKRDESGRVDREEIAKVIRDVVVERKGEDVRRKAKELSENMIKKGEEEITYVAEELLRLCVNNKHCTK